MGHYFQDKSIELGKKARTRSALLDGAISVVAQKGLGEATIKEIAKVSGLSNGTFYNYFDSRDEVVSAATLAIATEIADAIAEEISHIKNGVQRVVISTDAFIRHACAHPEWGKVIVSVFDLIDETRADMDTHLKRDIETGRSQNQFHVKVDKLLLEQVAALVVLGISRQLKGRNAVEVRRKTCAAILRLLGQTPVEAENSVLEYLK